jgi:D-glycero-D-manno-heptose 1,7-bisphosphate phosphatase
MGIDNHLSHLNLKQRAVFLDRDGVLNRAIVQEGKPYPPRTLAEVEILPGVIKALQLLKKAGFVLIVVSNQPDVARGTTTIKAVEEINAYVGKKLPVDRFIVCYEDGDDSECRKPHPGMLFAGAKEFDIDLKMSFMIGDRWRDIDAGIAAGCKTFFIDYKYSEKPPDSYNFKVHSLLEAARIIIQPNKTE